MKTCLLVYLEPFRKIKRSLYKIANDVSKAVTPRPAHLQGTQSRHTKANLAKEPALFPRFLDTPDFGGHIHYGDTPKEGRTYNRGFGKIRAGSCDLRLCASIIFISSLTLVN